MAGKKPDVGMGRGGSDPAASFAKLKATVDRLRAPGGCPWDREQTPRSIRHFLLEEAHELVEAIDGGDPSHLCEELGDVMFQVLFLSRMAEDYRWFDVAEVMDRIKGKLVRRHPHVFGDAKAGDSRAVERSWETIKASEKGGTTGSVGEGIPATSPALSRAYRLGERAARVGFDWPETESIFEKLSEEKGELEAEMALLRKAKSDDERACLKVRLEEELGDIIFVLTNLSRRLGVDPEVALNGCNRRFIKRFDRMVAMIAEEKKDLAAMSIEEMDLAWKKAKKAVG